MAATFGAAGTGAAAAATTAVSGGVPPMLPALPYGGGAPLLSREGLPSATTASTVTAATAAAAALPLGGWDRDRDDDGAVNMSVCALGQVAGGALFAFLFGGLGFVLAGDADARSVAWAAGLIVGAFVGVQASKGSMAGANGGGGGNPFRGHARLLAATKMHPDAVSALVTFAGVVAVTVVYAVIFPRLPADHLCASIAAATGGWLAHPFADACAESAATGWRTFPLAPAFHAATSCGGSGVGGSASSFLAPRRAGGYGGGSGGDGLSYALASGSQHATSTAGLVGRPVAAAAAAAAAAASAEP